MMGDEETYPELNDFDVYLETIDSPLRGEEEYAMGILEGSRTYVGAIGCGKVTYYFPITDSQTLVITYQLIQILSDHVPPSTRDKILKVTGAISQEEHKEIFENILTSFRFTN